MGHPSPEVTLEMWACKWPEMTCDAEFIWDSMEQQRVSS